MAKSRGTTDPSKTFFGVRHAQLRDWSWACLLIVGLACSHLWRTKAWERRLKDIPQATVASLRCWLEDMDAYHSPRSSTSVWKERTQRGQVLPKSSGDSRRESVFNPKRQLGINRATAEEWADLPGIGLVLSRRIVKFRSALGGFVSLDQLHEVYGLDSAVIALVRPSLALEPNSHEFICLDSLTFGSLVRHPLFDADQTRQVLRAWGRGTSVEVFWARLSASEVERQTWEPYLQVCRAQEKGEGVELER